MKKNSNVRRWVDRVLTANVWTQLGLFLIIFLVAWVGLLLLYNFAFEFAGYETSFVNRMRMTLADIFSPDRFASCAYGDKSIEINSIGIRIVTAISCIVGAVVFQGLLIATVINIIQTRADKVRKGNVEYKFDNHYLILGYDQCTLSLIRQLHDKDKYADIVLMLEKDVEDCHETIVVAMEEDVIDNVTLLHGNRNNEDDLKSACVSKAKWIYVVGEEGETNRDIRNMECYNIITKKLRLEIDCSVYSEEQTFFNLQIHYGPEDAHHFHPYNYQELWARRILVDNENEFSPIGCRLDFRSIDDNISVHPEKNVHLVLVGMTKMAEALARETAFVAHYPNYITHGKRTLITFADCGMQQHMQSFIGRNQSLFMHCNYSYRYFDETGASIVLKHQVEPDLDFIDIEFEFIESGPFDIHMRQLMEDWAVDSSQYLTIAFCTDNENQNYLLGHNISERLSKIPVWVYMFNHPQHDLFKPSCDFSMFSNVRYFGGPEVNIVENSPVLLWAKCVNHTYNLLVNDKAIVIDSQFFSDAEKEWETLPINKEWSNFYNACSISYKLRSVGAILENGKVVNPERVMQNVEFLGESEHNRWNTEQLLIGYRATTPEEHAAIQKDPMLKKKFKQRFIHDDIRPFKDLIRTRGLDTNLLINLVKIIDGLGEQKASDTNSKFN